MSPTAPQKELFAHLAPIPGTVFVNDRVCVETEQGQRVLFVHGIVFSHYSIQDRSAEAYAMVQLFESGYADQNDIARCFGYSAQTLRRYQERFKAGGANFLWEQTPEGHRREAPWPQEDDPWTDREGWRRDFLQPHRLAVAASTANCTCKLASGRKERLGSGPGFQPSRRRLLRTAFSLSPSRPAIQRLLISLALRRRMVQSRS
jgi:hypothetical protein